MSEEKHFVVGIWKTLRPDTRQYKQQSIEVEFSQPIAVDIPAEMVYKTVKDPKTGEITDILTPAGLRYVQEQFEKLFTEQAEGGWETTASKTVQKAEDEGWEAPATSSDGTEDDWGDVKSTKGAEDEGWETETSKVNEATFLNGDVQHSKPDDDWTTLIEDEPKAKTSDEGWDPTFDDEPESTGNTPDTETWNEDEEDWK